MKLPFLNLSKNPRLNPLIVAVIGVAAMVIIFITAWLTRGNASLTDATKLYQKGDIKQAEEMFAAARNRRQIITAEDWNVYGNILRDLRRVEDAADAYQQAVKIDSGYEAVYRNLSYLYLDWANDTNDSSKLQQAITIIEAGRKSNPKSVTIVEDLIMLYGKVGNSAKVSELTAIRTQLLK